MNTARTHRRSLARLLPLAGVAGVFLLSCMATPPSAVLAFEGGKVRAADSLEAKEVQGLLRRLRPEILEMLPDSQFDDLEVWVQEHPSLYRYTTEATADAEGLWSPSHRRIMLSRHADHVERTLAHELTHAVLGDSWSLLPGSMEEGLADHVSAALCDDGAARLRAGRLSSACLATGGLEIDVDVARIEPGRTSAPRGWSARVKLKGDTEATDPMDVFRLSAGLSSTRLDTGAKRGYYGLAYLVVSRIVERGGYDELHRLCETARDAGEDSIRLNELLAAAELTRDVDDWRKAAAAAMGPEEVTELLRMYPDFLIDALSGYVDALPADRSAADRLAELHVEVRLHGGKAVVTLEDLPFVRTAVLDGFGESEQQRPMLASAHR